MASWTCRKIVADAIRNEFGDNTGGRPVTSFDCNLYLYPSIVKWVMPRHNSSAQHDVYELPFPNSSGCDLEKMIGVLLWRFIQCYPSFPLTSWSFDEIATHRYWSLVGAETISYVATDYSATKPCLHLITGCLAEESFDADEPKPCFIKH